MVLGDSAASICGCGMSGQFEHCTHAGTRGLVDFLDHGIFTLSRIDYDISAHLAAQGKAIVSSVQSHHLQAETLFGELYRKMSKATGENNYGKRKLTSAQDVI